MVEAGVTTPDEIAESPRMMLFHSVNPHPCFGTLSIQSTPIRWSHYPGRSGGRRTTGCLSPDRKPPGSTIRLTENPERVTKPRARLAQPASAGGRGKVTFKMLENFTRLLSSLLAAGVPLSRALVILYREAVSPAAGEK